VQRALARMERRELLPPQGVLGTAEAVEDLQLRRGQRQLPVLMLAVEREQRATGVAQLGRGRAAPVEVRARAAFRAHAPRQHELLGVVGNPLPQLRAQVAGQLEAALDICLGGARAHDPGARLPPQQQVERVREHGLSRTGLAGQDVEPRREAQLGSLDQQQVLYTQLLQHE
jgi:hypothetical protein